MNESKLPNEISGTEQNQGNQSEITKKIEDSEARKPSDRFFHREVEKEIKEAPPEKQVELLIELAKKTNVGHAVEVARRLKDDSILDRLHDEIANRSDELKDALKLKNL